jgi:hypothetical protein
MRGPGRFVSGGRPPRRRGWSARAAEPPRPTPIATVSADRAREIAQVRLSREYEGLFALPPLLGALRGREVWFIRIGMLGRRDSIGEMVIDAVTGQVGDLQVEDPPARPVG